MYMQPSLGNYCYDFLMQQKLSNWVECQFLYYQPKQLTRNEEETIKMVIGAEKN